MVMRVVSTRGTICAASVAALSAAQSWDSIDDDFHPTISGRTPGLSAATPATLLCTSGDASTLCKLPHGGRSPSLYGSAHLCGVGFYEPAQSTPARPYLRGCALDSFGHAGEPPPCERDRSGRRERPLRRTTRQPLRAISHGHAGLRSGHLRNGFPAATSRP